MQESPREPVISIVIPCLNEEDHVGALLGDIATQQQAPDFEVIVVDSNSDDATVDVAEQWRGRMPLTVVRLNKRGVARARNVGADAASKQWLLFLDADVRLPHAHFLRQLANSAAYNSARYATTHIRADGRHPFDHLFYWGSSRFFESMFRKHTPRMTGAIMFVDYLLHQQVGGFDESREAGEDVLYSEKLAHTGETGVFVNSLRVTCSSRRFRDDGRFIMMARLMGWNYDWWPRKWSFMDNYFNNRHKRK